jgi:hypothetical protein
MKLLKPIYAKGDEQVRLIKEAIDSANYSIEILGTDLFSLKHPIIMEGLRVARSQGPAVSIYLTTDSEKMINELKSYDVKIMKGASGPCFQEYVIFDGSIAQTRVVGENLTGYWTNAQLEPKKVQALVEEFDRLEESEFTHIISKMKNPPQKRVRVGTI